MSIRFVLTNRRDGTTAVVDAPRRGEFVKNGVRSPTPPDKSACQALMAQIKATTKLGVKGGVLA